LFTFECFILFILYTLYQNLNFIFLCQVSVVAINLFQKHNACVECRSIWFYINPLFQLKLSYKYFPEFIPNLFLAKTRYHRLLFFSNSDCLVESGSEKAQYQKGPIRINNNRDLWAINNLFGTLLHIVNTFFCVFAIYFCIMLLFYTFLTINYYFILKE